MGYLDEDFNSFRGFRVSVEDSINPNLKRDIYLLSRGKFDFSIIDSLDEFTSYYSFINGEEYYFEEINYSQ